jgi:hypothetical protein
MLQLEKANTILNAIPFTGFGERSAKDLEMVLEREGFKESNRNIRRYLAYLHDINKITYVRTEGLRKYFARIKENQSSMSFEQAMVLKKVKRCITELFPTAVNDSLEGWFEQADETITKLAHSSPNHPLLKYAKATQAINVKAFFSAQDGPITDLSAANDALYQDKEIKLKLQDSEYERHVKPTSLNYRNGVAYLEGNYLDSTGQSACIPIDKIENAECVDFIAFSISSSPSHRS